MKKAKATYTISRDGSFVVWFEGYEVESKFFGFFTAYTYDGAYAQADDRCNSSGYRMESFARE
jgi:hypothetical protein